MADRTSIGLLILRIGAGGLMLVNHGWDKLVGFKAAWGSFPNPLGVGNELSQIVTVFAEFFCSIAVILGLKTKLASLPLLIVMLVAGFIVHAGDSLAQKEMALIYATCFGSLSLLGGGRYALKD